jgi:hypothetical protein
MDLTTALQNLMIFVIEFLGESKKVSKDVVKNQLQQWIEHQASFIKALFRNFCWESFVIKLKVYKKAAGCIVFFRGFYIGAVCTDEETSKSELQMEWKKNNSVLG